MSSLGNDDDRLLTRIRAGDAAAFECLVDRYAGALERYARRLLSGTGHDAEELMQDVFVKAWNGLLRTPTSPVAMRPWLYTITRNACLDKLRKPLRTLSFGDLDTNFADPTGDPAVRVAHGEALRLVVDELQRLPARQRDALVKCALEGRTHEQVAAELGVSIAASKSLVHRARATMTAHRAGMTTSRHTRLGSAGFYRHFGGARTS